MPDYQSIFDAAPVGIAHVGLDGQWLRSNQRLCDLLGYSRDELRSAGVQKLIDEEDAADEAESFQRMAEGTLNRHVVNERRYRRQDGSFVWARVNLSVHRDAFGKAQHFILVIEDITERRTLEAQVQQANKMDAIARLACGVAHDFNNLLTVVLGFAELVAEDAALPAQHAKDLDEIITAAKRATGVTRQLLAFGREQVLSVESLDVNRLITDMTAVFGRLLGASIDVTFALDSELSLALADRDQLQQVVMNLVVNARDAMPGGGSVTIETKDVELENSVFHDETIVPGRYVMVAVSDTGGGLNKDARRRLFEPFAATADAGSRTGLGLSTTYGIVKQSKGYIWVYSELDRGTTFKVYLPRSSDVATAVARPAAAAPVTLASETVLLVEDEAGVRQLSKRILDNAGYRVIEAANGNDAERLFDGCAGSVDLVLTDVIMPGCGGPELLSRLQARAPTLRVLYMSGYSQDSAANRTDFDRGVPFLQKPFTAAELVRQVRDALDR